MDRLIQTFAYGLGVGFSSGWWRSQHNRHHAMPQRLHHDVDLNTLPLIAFNVAVTKGGQHKPNFFLRHQAKLLS
ncbi:unnamed protein product [Allacma fusca]|uniref:Fatty acid desaturase domain-containing protein n=1 Tax=Allacma fusca TaxID=39272 RepID=A0A8J2M8U5_9HEXA|nr:unnamed protein product [Allacma fusca]